MTFNYDTAIKEATKAADDYYNGISDMSDDQYDYLLDEIRAYEEANPEEAISHALFTEVAAGQSNDSADIKHDVPMLSLRKVNDTETMNKFVQKHKGQKILAEPKIDGIALVLKYENGSFVQAATRGDGQHGENMTSRILKHKPEGIPLTVPHVESFEVRGELYMTHEDLIKTNEVRQQWEDEYLALRGTEKSRSVWDYPILKNTRNGVSGAFRSENLDKTITVKGSTTTLIAPKAHMSFAVYDALFQEKQDTYTENLELVEELGFTTARSLLPEIVKEAGDPIAMIEALGENRDDLAYPIDGCVLKLDSMSQRDLLGADSRAPRWAMAYKYANKTAITVVRDIEPSVGRTGRLALRARMDKVEIDGSEIQYASVHNVDWLMSKDVRVGDTVILSKANDIIPQVQEVVYAQRPDDSMPWEPPATCPQCGEEWNKDTLLWRCESPECSVLGTLIYAAGRTIFDWDGFSTALITQLVEEGRLNDTADVFTLTKEELTNIKVGSGVNMDGSDRVLGETSAQKIYDNIQKSKDKPLSIVIASLGIRMLGRTFGRRLAAKFHTMSNIQDLTLADWLAQDDMGIAQKRAEVFHEGILNRAPLIEKLAAQGVNMGSEEESSPASKALEGLKIVVTGSMKGSPLENLTREGMKDLIESHGAKSSSSVSSTTSILVCGEEGSSKWKKAKELGIEILTPAEFAEKVGV